MRTELYPVTCDDGVEPDHDYATNEDMKAYLDAHPDAQQRPPAKPDPGIFRRPKAEPKRLFKPVSELLRHGETTPRRRPAPKADPTTAA
jgi:hypothetical protein